MNVLVVDDERDIAYWLAEALPLADRAFRVRSFTHPANVGADDIRWAHAAVIDWMMPTESGEQLAARIAATNPDCRVVVLTAAPHLTDHLDLPVLTKPVDVATIAEELRGP